MLICSRTSKKLWLGSEVSLVTKNVFESLKILMCITVSTFNLSGLHQRFKAVFCGGKRKFENINCRKISLSPFSKLIYPFLPTWYESDTCIKPSLTNWQVLEVQVVHCMFQQSKAVLSNKYLTICISRFPQAVPPDSRWGDYLH